jgi:hypothetical protein
MNSKPDPNATTIAKKCEEIRRTWTPATARRRWQGPAHSRWTLPNISEDDVEAAEKELTEN